MLAALTADAELMRTLAALGADPLLTNADNSTPLMAAAGLGLALAGRGSPARRAKCSKPCRSLLDLGADINAVDKNGETAMHGAAYKNLPKVVKFLAGEGREDRRLEQGRQVRTGRRWRSPSATGSATSSRHPKPRPRFAK